MFEDLQAEIAAYRAEISAWRIELTSAGREGRAAGDLPHWTEAQRRLRDSRQFWLDKSLVGDKSWAGSPSGRHRALPPPRRTAQIAGAPIVPRFRPFGSTDPS